MRVAGRISSSLGLCRCLQGMASSEGYANQLTTVYVHSQTPDRPFNLVPALPTPATSSRQPSLYIFAAPGSPLYGTGLDESHDSGGEMTLEYAYHPQRLSMWPVISGEFNLDSESLPLKPNEGDASEYSLSPEAWLESCFHDDSKLALLPSPDASSFDSQIQGSDSTFPSAPTTIGSPEYVLGRSISSSDGARKQMDMLKVATRKKGQFKSTSGAKKYPAEIRISKMLRPDEKFPKDKAWLGTFATAAEKERALDVGKYFLSIKKKKNFSNSKSEALLSVFQDSLHQLPLPELVEIVTKMAKYYGKNGLLPDFLHDL